MDTSRFSKAVLATLRLSQLRELARRLGVGRYSSMLRSDLLTAIQVRAPREAVAEAPAALEPLPSRPLEVSHQEGVLPPAPLETLPASTPIAVGSYNDPTPTHSDAPLTPAEPVASAPAAELFSTWVAFQPLDPQWAVVRWGIPSHERERALAEGGQQLALRVTDVTDRPAGDGRPHTLQELLVAASASEWHIPIPLGDRDYRVELGYRTAGGGWMSLGFSSPARMPADVDLSMVGYFPFSIEDTQEETPESLPPLPMSGLHERLYQQSSVGFYRNRIGSEEFHEQGAGAHGAAGGHLSGAGPWASGREASGAGIAPRQRSFWLVADAELIVYGATDPAATLSVGDETVPLSSDGTFSFHVPFPDGDQNYPIQAVAADGEQKRSITLDFRRSTPHAQVNTKEAAVAEWF